jgi:uncharacterized protein (TIGR02271 family)
MTDDDVNAGRFADADHDESEPLGRLDEYEVADGYPDVRGWRVATPQDEQLGIVRELLVDTNRLEVRYLVVTLDRSAPMNATGGDVRVPIESVRIDTDGNRVVAEAAVLGGAARGMAGDARTREEVIVERLPVAEGARSPATSTDVAAAATGEGDIRAPTVEEEVVVEPRPAVEDELVIRTSPVTEQHEVEADLRRERMDIDRRK